jgi:hypothetical protein
MRKVLIIAYYFPPMGGSGVQRPFQMAKYLREFGWEPVILTQAQGAYTHADESLLNEVEALQIPVYRTESSGWTPQTLPFLKQGVQQPSTSGAIHLIRPGRFRSWLLSLFTRWFFIPDNKVPWISSAIQTAGEIIRNHKIDLILSTAPPFSSFLAARTISQTHKIPLVLDFRDAWLENQYHRPPTLWHRNRMRRMEQEIVSAASAIIAINERTANGLRNRIPERSSIRVDVIPNGYDPGKRKDSTPTSVGSSDSNLFSILHAGQLFSSSSHKRQPEIRLLFRALDHLFVSRPDLLHVVQLVFAGHPEPLITRWVQAHSYSGTAPNIIQTGYLSHSAVLEQMLNANALLLTLSSSELFRGVTPGKMFEYFGTQKPIYALVPDGEASRYLTGYGGAIQEHTYSAQAIAHSLSLFIDKGRSGTLPDANPHFAVQFNRRNQAEQIAKMFDEVVSNP